MKDEVVQSSVKSSYTKEEIKLEAVFASSPNGITVTDQNVNITECNQATLDMFGYSSKDEVIGKNALEFIAKKDQQRAMENLKKTLEQGSMANVEYTFFAKDGHEFPAELSASTIKDTSGKPIGFVAIVRDIIEHKKAEDKLKESEEKYRTQFEEALDAIFAADAETGIIIDCNREATKLVGREKSEIVGNHQRILHPPKVIKGKFSRTFKQHRKEKEGQVLETQVITKNGEIKDVAIKANVFKLGDKRILQGIFRDITEQKKDEKALQEAEERYRKTIVNANVGIITYGPEGEVKVLNPKMEEITGFKRTEIPTLVNWFEKLYPNEEERRKVRDKWFKRMSDEGEVKEGHAIITTKEGKRRNFLFNGVQLESGDSIAFAHDITERKQAEEALRASEEKHRVISGITADVVFSCAKVDEEGFAIDWMAGATEKIFGYSAKEIKDKGCWKFTVQPQDLPTFEEKVTGLKPGQSSVCELRITREDGSTRWIKASSQVTKDSSTPTNHRLFGACRDITERKQLEDNLRSSEEKFRAISASAMDAIILVDDTGKISYWNPAAERIFGYAKEEAVGEDMEKLLMPPQYNGFHSKSAIQSLEDVGQTYGRMIEFKALRKDGTKVPIELSVSTLKLKDRTCMLGIVRDVSERKKMEENLRQDRDMLEAITENLGAGFAIISKDYRVLWVNRFVKNNAGDVEGKQCYSSLNTLDHICPDCGVRKVFEKGVARDSHEYSNIGINGNPYYVELIATPLKDKDGNVTAALEFIVDIAEKKRMQSKLAEYSQKLEKLVDERTEQLKQTQAKLVKTERLAAIGELAAMVGHDLRNPLQAIDNATYYLKNVCACMPSSAIPPKAKIMLQVIGDSVNYADKIVRDLSDFSATKKPLLKRIDINMLVKETVSQAGAPRNVKINTELSQRLEIKVDEDQIKRVFLNLVANGIQAMENGGTLTVSTRKAEGFVEISFKDTGVGIPQDNMDKIFSPFFTTKAKGMGMGLAICKKFVESHGGTIHVESEVGKGTTFTVKLPIRHETEVKNIARE